MDSYVELRIDAENLFWALKKTIDLEFVVRDGPRTEKSIIDSGSYIYLSIDLKVNERPNLYCLSDVATQSLIRLGLPRIDGVLSQRCIGIGIGTLIHHQSA